MEHKQRKPHSWLPPMAYGLFLFNTLCLLLAALDYLLCEIDLFLLVFIVGTVAIVSGLVGLLHTIYALFHLRNPFWRTLALWGLSLALTTFVVFWLLPPGTSRVPSKMEKYYLRHQTAMTSLANTIYASMPDSTCLVIQSSGQLVLSPIRGKDNYWGYPILADTVASQSLPATFPKDSILGLMKQIHCPKVEVYKPTALALFHYLKSGFASYWFELTLVPFTPEQMQHQLLMYNALPYSPQVCFRFHGGATDGDASFPYKDDFLRQHPIATDLL